MKEFTEDEWKEFQKEVERLKKMRDAIGVCFFTVIIEIPRKEEEDERD